MDNKAFIFGALALLLLFGCVGQPGGTGAAGGGGTKPGAGVQAAGGVGDADIGVSGPVNDTDLIPVVEGVEAGAVTVPVTPSSLSALDGDVDVCQVNETDLLTDVDGIEQG